MFIWFLIVFDVLDELDLELMLCLFVFLGEFNILGVNL